MSVKNILLFIFFCSVFCSGVNAQNANRPLLFIDGMPVKIDGGCSFFVKKEIALSDDKSQLIIDALHWAYIEFEPHNFIFFKRTRRINTTDGYVDLFTAKQGTLILNINKIEKGSDFSTIRSGILQVKYNNISQEIRVHGRVDEVDKYYYQFYPKSH